MAAYLIDYENVKSEGIRGILQLCEQDSVIIFYSHNADTLTFETMDMIFGSKATVRKYKIVRGGKNALDFQLSTYLGYLIHEGKDSCFYIISKDNGFQHVVEFWKRTFNYDGYVYCFPTIADAYAKHRRFEATSAKEREKAIEDDMLALQETVQEEEPIPAVSEAPVTEPVSEESADQPVAADETEFDETLITEDTQNEEDDSVEDDKSEPIITITSHEDNFIIETIHEENTAVTLDEPAEPAPKPAQIPVFSASLAEKIAAAVPDSWLKVTVVENNVTVHQVPDEAETTKPAAVSELPQTTPITSETQPEEAKTTVAETAENTPKPEISVIPETAAVIPEPETVSEEVTVSSTEEPEEKPQKPAAKKKTRQTSKKKPASPKSDTSEEKIEEQKAESEKEAVAEPEAAVVEPAAAEVQEENISEETAKPARRRQSHHGGRRKKNPAAPTTEPETPPAAASSEEKESERKQHHAHTGGQRGRRPKAQKSEAAAFAD